MIVIMKDYVISQNLLDVCIHARKPQTVHAGAEKLYAHSKYVCVIISMTYVEIYLRKETNMPMNISDTCSSRGLLHSTGRKRATALSSPAPMSTRHAARASKFASRAKSSNHDTHRAGRFLMRRLVAGCFFNRRSVRTKVPCRL